MFFCVNTMKIGLLMLWMWNHNILHHGIALGQWDHFETGKLQNLSKIGVTSHEVGGAKAKVGEAPTPPTE